MLKLHSRYPMMCQNACTVDSLEPLNKKRRSFGHEESLRRVFNNRNKTSAVHGLVDVHSLKDVFEIFYLYMNHQRPPVRDEAIHII